MEEMTYIRFTAEAKSMHHFKVEIIEDRWTLPPELLFWAERGRSEKSKLKLVFQDH